MTDFEYYDDPSQWGNYQYITLEDVVNNFMAMRSDDDYTITEPRHKILIQARRGLRELYYDVMRDIRAISRAVSPTLTIPLPPDYINYVRVSWVDGEGNLHPMAVNSNKTYADSYLQDHNYELLFDSEGCVLQDSSIMATGAIDPDKRIIENGFCESYKFCGQPFVPNKNMSHVYPNGSFIIDQRQGVIQFSSDIESKYIVLEYISDGLFTGCAGQAESKITVHKFAERALMNFIYHELIVQRKNVPMNEKMRANKAWGNSRRIAKRRIATLRRSEILQGFKVASKWIKK